MGCELRWPAAQARLAAPGKALAVKPGVIQTTRRREECPGADHELDRRTLLIGSAAWGLASAAASAGPEATMVFGPQAPFSFDTLTGKARGN